MEYVLKMFHISVTHKVEIIRFSEVFYRLVITCPKRCESTWGSPSLSLGWEPHQCCWHVLEKMLFFSTTTSKWYLKRGNEHLKRDACYLHFEQPIRWLGWVGPEPLESLQQDHSLSPRLERYKKRFVPNQYRYKSILVSNFWRFVLISIDWKLWPKKDVKNLSGSHIFLQDYWWQRARWGWYRTRSPPRSQNTDGRFQPSLSSEPRFLPLKDSRHQWKGFDTRTVTQPQSFPLKPWTLCWNFVEHRVTIPRSVTNVHCELWTSRLLAVWTIKGRSNELPATWQIQLQY